MLQDARESLGYWENRLQRLPRHQVHQRREARAMAARWRARVSEAERSHYGQGLLGAALMLAAERRLPEDTRHAGRQAARVATRAAVAAVVLLTALLVAAGIVAVELLVAILRAL